MMYENQRGTTLIEVLVASAILLVGIIPLMRVYMYELHMSNRSYKMSTATNLARDMAEEIRSQHFCEELAQYSSGAYKTKWPWTDAAKSDTTRQSFGLDGSESHDPSKTAGSSNGGRIRVFNDVDDYDGWCRGRDCPGTYAPLETFDGQEYDGTGGYDDYGRVFTRRVRIRNLDTRPTETYQRDPYNAGNTPMSFNRFDLEGFANVTALFCLDSACDTSGALNASGLTALKRIEVTVSVSGLGAENLEIQDVSYAVMPMTLPSGMAE